MSNVIHEVTLRTPGWCRDWARGEYATPVGAGNRRARPEPRVRAPPGRGCAGDLRWPRVRGERTLHGADVQHSFVHGERTDHAVHPEEMRRLARRQVHAPNLPGLRSRQDAAVGHDRPARRPAASSGNAALPALSQRAAVERDQRAAVFHPVYEYEKQRVGGNDRSERRAAKQQPAAYLAALRIHSQEHAVPRGDPDLTVDREDSRRDGGLQVSSPTLHTRRRLECDHVARASPPDHLVTHDGRRHGVQVLRRVGCVERPRDLARGALQGDEETVLRRGEEMLAPESGAGEQTSAGRVTPAHRAGLRREVVDAAALDIAAGEEIPAVQHELPMEAVLVVVRLDVVGPEALAGEPMNAAHRAFAATHEQPIAGDLRRREDSAA